MYIYLFSVRLCGVFFFNRLSFFLSFARSLLWSRLAFFRFCDSGPSLPQSDVKLDERGVGALAQHASVDSAHKHTLGERFSLIFILSFFLERTYLLRPC